MQQVKTAKDLESLKEITNKLLREPCWKVNLSYGDELTLHIGEKVAYSQKSMAHREKGSWILGTRATWWKIMFTNQTLVTSDEDSEILNQRIHIIENTKVVAFEIDYLDLSLSIIFSNEYELVLCPDKEDFDLPYWELFTPDQMLLKFGPGSAWSYIRADLPEASQPN